MREFSGRVAVITGAGSGIGIGDSLAHETVSRAVRFAFTSSASAAVPFVNVFGTDTGMPHTISPQTA